MPKRSFVIGRPQAGQPLVEVLRGQLHLGRDEVLRSVKLRRVRVDGRVWLQPGRQVRAGQRVEIDLAPRPREAPVARKPGGTRDKPALPAAAREIAVRYVDAQVVVVDKPPGLTTVRHADETAEFGARARRFLPPTLADLLPAVLAARGTPAAGRIRAVHRLDRETSGLLVLARTAEAERSLGQQFRRHGIGRHYLAVVRGRPADGRIESSLVPDRGDGRRGSGPAEKGQHAVTNVKVLEVLGAYSLVECRLETGRTHQVRIHLGEAGAPLCGDHVYDRPPHGAPVPDGSGARRPMLHAASLEFDHPTTGTRLRFTAPVPRDMKALLQRLRQGRGERIEWRVDRYATHWSHLEVNMGTPTYG